MHEIGYNFYFHDVLSAYTHTHRGSPLAGHVFPMVFPAFPLRFCLGPAQLGPFKNAQNLAQGEKQTFSQPEKTQLGGKISL